MRTLVAVLALAAGTAEAGVLKVAELGVPQVRELNRDRTAVILPGGILEEHGPYLPSYSDGYFNERIASDLADLAVPRHDLTIGVGRGEEPVSVPAYGSTFLLAGTSGGGKSTLVTAFVEQLVERGYQFCILDPEGDYTSLPGAAAVGDREVPATVAEVLELLQLPTANVVVNLVAIGIEKRPAFFEELMPQLL